MPLRRPRRSSVTRLSARTHLAQSSSLCSGSIVPLLRPPRCATPRRAKPRQAEQSRTEPRHATSHAVQADALFRKRAHLLFSTLHPPPLSSTRNPVAIYSPSSSLLCYFFSLPPFRSSLCGTSGFLCRNPRSSSSRSPSSGLHRFVPIRSREGPSTRGRPHRMVMR